MKLLKGILCNLSDVQPIEYRETDRKCFFFLFYNHKW